MAQCVECEENELSAHQELLFAKGGNAEELTK